MNCGPDETVGYWVNRASRLMVRDADARLRPFGLAMAYLPVLRALADGAAHSQSELARIAGVEQASMAETIVRMARDELVARAPHPDDKRAMSVSLTRRSKTRVPKAMTALMEGESDATKGLSDSEKSTLRALLQRVVENLES